MIVFCESIVLRKLKFNNASVVKKERRNARGSDV